MNDNYELANGDPDVWMEAQSDERFAIMVERAQRALEIDYVPEDEDHYLHESFVEAMQDEANKMLMQDLFAGMEEKGLVRKDGIDLDGEILWSITDLGREAYEAQS